MRRKRNNHWKAREKRNKKTLLKCESNQYNLSLSLPDDTLRFRVKRNSELKWPECWPSRTSWIATGSSMFLLMERFCLTQRILLPSTVEFDESEHRKTENIHFRFPFLTSWTSTFSLFKVPIAIGWVKPGGSTIYLCSKPEVYGNPINVSDGYLVYTWSDK